MAISFVAAGAVGTGTNPTVAVPAGYAQGDLLVIVTTGTAAPSLPSGWTSLRSGAPSTYLTIYYKFATGSESSVVLTMTGTASTAVMVAYRGVSATDVLSGISAGTSTTITTGTLTTTYANEYVVSVYTMASGAATWTAPASTTSRVNSAGTASVNGLLIVDEAQAAAGVSTARTATSSVSKALAAISFSIIPSGRYWVGGSGTWDTTTTTGWSFSSGGSSGAPVPTAQDNVTFDSATTYTVTCTGALRCNDITVSAGTVTFAQGTSPTFAISGSMSLVAATVWSATGGLTFNATSTGKTVTTNGVVIGGGPRADVTFSGTGGGWTLGSAFTTNGVTTMSAGTFSSGNYAMSLGGSGYYLQVSGGAVSFGSSTVTLPNGTANCTSGSINLGTSTVNNAGNWSINGTTITAGTSQINLSATSSPTFAGGGQTYYNVAFTGVSGASPNPSISGANTFNTLSFVRQSGIKTVSFSANQTIANLSFAASTDATYRLFVQSNSAGTSYTLTCAAITNLTDVDFQDITGAGAASWSGTRLGDCKGNSGITFDATKTVYWNLTGTQSWSATGWATASGGAPSVNNFPLAQDIAVFDNSGAATQVQITINWNIGTLNMSTRSSAMTLNVGSGTTAVVYGNWSTGSGITYSGSGRISFRGRGSQTISSNSKTFTSPITVNSVGGTLTLQDALTTSYSSSQPFSVTNGTIDLNGKTLTTSDTGSASVVLFSSGTGLTFNGGSLVINCSGTSAFTASGTLTTTAGTGTGTISLTSASAKTFAGNGNVYNCTLNQGGAGALTITGSNTFNNITNTYASTGATTITFTKNTTITVAAFTAAGQATRLLTLNSSLAGTQATIAYTGSGVASSDYLTIQDIAFTPFATDGTAPFRLSAGANSTNTSNNTGILFAAGVAYLILSGSSWTTPADWANGANTIHMVGGGGGGGATSSGSPYLGGGGGGGGGYTKITNASLSGTVSYSVGPAGAAGTSSGNGGAGGNTTFSSYTAGGGGGGTSASGGGTAGTGTTYNGGVGGAGGSGSTAGTGAGGGGGGAGGPNGTGGAGGIGYGNTSAQFPAGGGGGGGNGGGTAGGNGSTTQSGAGGNNSLGSGGGAALTATGTGNSGTNGGGGSGGFSTTVSGGVGGVGGAGIDIASTNSIGSGGGGGGGKDGVGGVAGNYGGGGGGGGRKSTATQNGAAGAQGLIFIIYTPGGGAGNTGNFFLMF